MLVSGATGRVAGARVSHDGCLQVRIAGGPIHVQIEPVLIDTFVIGQPDEPFICPSSGRALVHEETECVRQLGSREYWDRMHARIKPCRHTLRHCAALEATTDRCSAARATSESAPRNRPVAA